MRIIVADPCGTARRKRVDALSRICAATLEAATGWELLWLLAEAEGCDLVMSSRELPGISGPKVVEMARAAGLTTPFVLFDPVGGPPSGPEPQ